MRFLLFAALLLPPSLAVAGAPDSDAGLPDGGVADTRSPNPGATVEGLAAKVAELEERLGQDQRRRAEEATLFDKGLAALRAVPAVLAANGVHVSLTGFAQADFQWRQASEEQLDPATREPLNNTRFLLRRVRLKPQVEYGFVSGLLEADFNTVSGAQARVLGAEVAARWVPEGASGPLVQGTVGQFKVPFGFEVTQSDRERLFMERSTVVRALFPGEYDVGARLGGQWRFVRYAVALMNGHPAGEKQLPERAPVAPRDVVARLGVDASPVPAVRIEAGFSGLVGTGFHPGTAATKDQIVWRDINGDNLAQVSELQIIPGQPAQPSSTFPRQAVGGDLRVTLDLLPFGRTQVMGELIWSKNLDRGLSVSDPVALGRDLRGLGFHAGLTQELSRWFVAGVRYDRYNPDLDALDSRGGQVLPRDQSFSTLAVAVGFVYRPVLRVMAEYDHNTNALGRDATGVPTTLADDAVVLRAEVGF